MSAPMVAMAAVSALAAAGSTALQIKAQNKQAEATQQAAVNEYNNQVQQQEIREQQIAQQAGQELSERAKQAMRERAKLRTVTGESGIAGSTVDRLKTESLMSESYDVAVLEENISNVMKQEYFKEKGTQTRLQSEIDKAESSKTQGSMAGLQIGLSGLSGGISGYSSVK